MKNVIDAGHRYELLVLDGCDSQKLVFVKRCDLKNPERFPGNYNAYSGTTCQSVLRCLIDRVKYLQNQIWCPENSIILFCLKLVVWLFEFRAAHRHKRLYLKGLEFAYSSKMCSICGHTICEHKI